MTAKRALSNEGNKKELSPEQREELLKALKARFEKNMNRHKGLEWAKVQAKLDANAEKLRSLHEMEKLAVSRTWLPRIKRPASTFFMIVRRKVRKTVEAFATTAKRWSQEKNINRQILRLIWQLQWALSS